MAEEQQRHPNSKRIVIRRAGSFLENAQNAAAEFMSMSKQSIGSYYSNTMGGSAGSGLDFDEVRLLLPELIDTHPEERIFREKVTEFYKNIRTPVPYGTGAELEIGLKLDNNKPITYKNEAGEHNMPLNIKDYIRYRHAKKHPWVAPSEETARGNQLYHFYIDDPEAKEVADRAAGLLRDEAMKTYITIKTDGDKVDALLTLLDVDIRAYHGNGAEEAKSRKLYDLANENPGNFMDKYRLQHFEERFLIRKMINTEVIRVVGTAYTFKETGAILGYSLEELIVFLKDPKNSDQVSILKAKTQELMKKKLQAPKKPQAAGRGAAITR